jgi:hypothetical protein
MKTTITLNDGRTITAGRRDAGLALRLIQDIANDRDHLEYDFGGDPFTVGDVARFEATR